MKRLALLLAAALTLLACNQADQLDTPTKSVTFTIDGDFTISQSPMTRALEADGKSMTDIWVFDYQTTPNTHSIQTQPSAVIHQTSTDADFGTVNLPLTFGTHHLYFVTSRGRDAVINTTDATLTFVSVSDTFWKDHTITVTSSTATSSTVTLDRIATRLRVTVTDAIPEGAATLNVTPSTWYYGFNYTTGEPCAAATSQPIYVTLPSSVIGTTGVVASFFGFSASDQFTTDVAIDSKTSNGTVLGTATVTAVPFTRNTTTSVSGTLYAPVHTHSITVNADWEDPIDMTW